MSGDASNPVGLAAIENPHMLWRDTLHIANLSQYDRITIRNIRKRHVELVQPTPFACPQQIAYST